jgi:hypothetical protein
MLEQPSVETSPTTYVGKDVGKRNPNPLLVGMQTSTTTLKKIWRLLKNLNIDPPYDPAIHSWGYTQRNWTQVTPEALAHPCLLQHYSQ